MTEFRAQLDSLGLKIVEVNADGNCFFRFKIRLILLIVHVPVVLIKRGYLILIDMLVHILFMRYLSCMTTHCSIQGNE